MTKPIPLRYSLAHRAINALFRLVFVIAGPR